MRPSGFKITPRNDEGESWPAFGCVKDRGSLTVDLDERGTPESSDIILEVAITGQTDSSVTKFIRDTCFDYRVRRRVRTAELDNDSVQGSQHAIDIADHVRRQIKDLRQQFGGDSTIHVFYYGPLALTILIGYRLNALGRFQFYEFTPNGYVPSVRLGDADY